MALYGKLTQAGDTWLLLDDSGQRIGRVWVTTHVDCLLRDGDLAEAIAAVMNQSGATRRANARTALQTWTTAGGHSVDFNGLAISLDNPPGSGNVDGKRHLFNSGTHVGYLDIPSPETNENRRLARAVRLAEECFAAEQLGTSSARNAALDSAINTFRDAGGATRT